MLVLTRDLKDATLLIGDDIQVKVVNVKGNQVRLAISAPDDVNIVRTELLPPDQQPKGIPDIPVRKRPNGGQDRGNRDGNRDQETSGRGDRSNGNNRGNSTRHDLNRRSARSNQRYKEPRQLTPNYASQRPEEETHKPDKIPVISLKRRRKTTPPDEDA